MRRRSNLPGRKLFVRSAWPAPLLCFSLALFAQSPQPAAQRTPPVEKKGKEYTITVNVNEVVLHATVLDKKGHIVNDLKQDDFHVFEDGVPQTLSHFAHADVPVTMGIVIDDSGSMQTKRQAVNAAFEAMSTWRSEAVDNSEKNIEKIIEKMSAAAREMGWPEQIVEATRTQLQTIAKLQIQTMDHMMDAWEEQIKSSSPSSALLSKLSSLPGVAPAGSWPGAAASPTTAMNPFGVYMQMAEQWQKAWTDAMASWTKGGKH